ncbi:hypothetical protein [Clostridium sp.]|uniref:hypothetical protein n=1 Tax=Clostridium sp. TaxID=1506 RepID=UPI0032179AA5
MLILEITISKDRTIDSISLKINDNLIEYLISEEVPIRGASSFLMKKFEFGRMKLNIAV